MNASNIGRVNELHAQVWLLEQGYQVFQNVSPVGPADLVVWDYETNTFMAIDVKTVTPYLKEDGTKTYKSSLGSTKKRDNVIYLGYCKEEDSFTWL